MSFALLPPSEIAASMRKHVQDRGGLSLDDDGKPVCPNGAWAMMLAAADAIETLLTEQSKILDDLADADVELFRAKDETLLKEIWLDRAREETGLDADADFNTVWTETVSLARQAKGFQAARAAASVPTEHRTALTIIDAIRSGLPAVTRGPWRAMEASQPIGDFSHGLIADGYGCVGYWKGHKSFHNDNMWVLTKPDAEHIARLNPVDIGKVISLVDHLTAASTFQRRFQEWMLVCLGQEQAECRLQRNHRLLEETLELVQAAGCSREDAHHLVDYVFDRETGELRQEIGGVITTLAAFASAYEIDMMDAGEAELSRVWRNMAKIRAKQASKPTSWAVAN